MEFDTTPSLQVDPGKPSISPMLEICFIQEFSALEPFRHPCPSPFLIADPLKWHQIVLHRTPLGNKFGKTPVVAIRLTVTHDEEVIYQNGSDDLTWYEDIPMSEKPPIRVKDNSKAEGYQYTLLVHGVDADG